MRSISINLRKNENIIKIQEEAIQKDIIKELKQKLPDLKKLYKEEKMPIRVTGKALKNAEMEAAGQRLGRCSGNPSAGGAVL